jgi:hypothetical protein
MMRAIRFGGATSEDEIMTEQLLHLVLGGEMEDLDKNNFADLENVDVVGLYPNYATAKDAWRSKAQGTVDDAKMRYFIVHIHRLLDPADD